MLQTILSLMLAAVQVLAWNAAPVYLCLEADGSACVDRGPAFCNCCQPGNSEHDCGEVGCSHRAPEKPSSDEYSLSEGPCGCEHEQISDAQAAVRAQDRADFELTDSPATHVTAAVSDISSLAVALLTRPIEGTSSSSALAARAGIVLRI